MADHSVKEAITRQTTYNALNRRKKGQSSIRGEIFRLPLILDIIYEEKVEKNGRQLYGSECVKNKEGSQTDKSTVFKVLFLPIYELSLLTRI